MPIPFQFLITYLPGPLQQIKPSLRQKIEIVFPFPKNTNVFQVGFYENLGQQPKTTLNNFCCGGIIIT